MTAKQAIAKARAYFDDLFASEAVVHVGLEEVVFDEHAGSWLITIGFARPWDVEETALSAFRDFGGSRPRSYKVVKMADDDGRLIAITNHEAVG